MLTVVCCKWKDPDYRYGDVYTAEHVNKLVAGVARNLRMPHRFVCFTDDPSGIDSSVDCHPIWEDAAEFGWAYRRLKLFDDGQWLRDAVGERFVSIDLDAVIVGDLTPLFSRTEPFVAYHNMTVRHRFYCGALWMLEAGAFPFVWHTFNTPDITKNVDLTAKHNVVGSDQVWMSIQLGHGHPVWTADDGCYHFKMDLHQPHKLPMNELPEGARIVLFNGHVDPTMTELYRNHPWIPEHWRT